MEIDSNVRQVIQNVLNNDMSTIKSHAKLGSLKADFIQLTQITLDLAERFDIKIEETEINSESSIQEITDLIRNKIN